MGLLREGLVSLSDMRIGRDYKKEHGVVQLHSFERIKLTNGEGIKP